MADWDVRDLVETVTREVLARLGAVHPAAGPAVAAPDRSVATAPGSRRPLVAANWKMNPCEDRDVTAYVAHLAVAARHEVDVLLLPPAVLLPTLAQALTAAGLPEVILGGQDLHWEAKGAHTGELSAALLQDAGAEWALVGHSERRQAGESDEQVARKARSGLQAGLSVMLCVGERLDERRQGATFRRLRQQLLLALAGCALQPPAAHRLAVAYEPVWAIGTGERATPEQVQEASAFIRQVLAEIFDHARARSLRVLYGGSVTADNAAEIMALPDVDGVLVGGASLGGRSFAAIVEAAAAAKSASDGSQRRVSAGPRRSP